MSEENDPIECRAAVEISPTSRNEVLFLPIGLHSITPVAGGIGRPIKVKVDASTADAIEQQRRIMAGKGKRPYFDFDHEDGAASFWPESFIWRGGEGVIAKGEWTARGRKAVEGKDYRAFSPVFHVDNKRSDPATVICTEHAAPNMGGLVNNPAFNLPLWAKNAGASGALTTKEKQKMTNEEIDALRSKQQELHSRIQALGADGDDETIKAKMEAAQAESDAIESKIEAAELKASNDALVAKQRKRQLDDARLAVRNAVKRGAIAARDLPKQRMWETRIAADPKDQEILDSIPGNMKELGSPIISGGRVTVTDEDPSKIYGEMARISALSHKTADPRDRRQLARQLHSIYASELSLNVVQPGSAKAERMLSFPLQDMDAAIMAADVTDANLETLSGTLVTQRTLELLKFTFPALSMFTTDFSDQPAQFNQTVITRTVGIPSVVTYNTTTGWADSTATTNDVPITIDHHEGTQITFNENVLASTVRRIFDEQAPAAAYALAKSMVDALYANITDANFTHNRVIATSAVTRAGVVSIGTDLDLLGVPRAMGSRTLLLYPTAFEKLVVDSTLVTLAAYREPRLITNPQNQPELVIPVDTFQVVSAPNLPTNNGNITGFAGSKSALLIATRVPNDYTAAMPGSAHGNVQIVTNPDIGLSVMLVQYVDHKLGRATSRLALMYGTAAGQTDAGELLKAASGSGSSRA